MVARRPMLAVNATEADIQKHLHQTYLIASPKLDGIRGVVQDGVLLSRSLKPIRNKYVQSILGRSEFNGLDGELIVGSPTAKDVYRKTNSAVMTIEGEPKFLFYMFDDLTQARLSYAGRLSMLANQAQPHDKARFLSFKNINSVNELIEYETILLEAGHEGLIIRRPDRPYKHNRSTLREGGMMKLKRFKDAEAVVLSVVEMEHNNNPAEINEQGLTSRASHDYYKIAAGTMGSLRVRNPKTGQVFNLGTGFTAVERQYLWDKREALKGCIVKYKYFAVGVKDLPRHPVYLGLRDVEDL